jgi:hypothetical protein
MSFTNDQGLELIASGGADWDTSVNANFAILESGIRVKATAGDTVNSGWVCTLTGSGTVLPLDAKSSAFYPHLMSMSEVASGAEGRFMSHGIVRSMGIWSGFITPGAPVFVAQNSPGLLTSSYAGHGEPCGVALAGTAVRFWPGYPRVFPSLVTEVYTSTILNVGTFVDFAVPIGRRTIVRDLVARATHDRFKIQFWSSSTRADSQLVYETLTRSWSPGSADVTSNYFRDGASFPFQSTDVGSAWLMHGRFTAQSGTSVTTGYISVTVIAERFD